MSQQPPNASQPGPYILQPAPPQPTTESRYVFALSNFCHQGLARALQLNDTTELRLLLRRRSYEIDRWIWYILERSGDYGSTYAFIHKLQEMRNLPETITLANALPRPDIHQTPLPPSYLFAAQTMWVIGRLIRLERNIFPLSRLMSAGHGMGFIAWFHPFDLLRGAALLLYAKNLYYRQGVRSVENLQITHQPAMQMYKQPDGSWSILVPPGQQPVVHPTFTGPTQPLPNAGPPGPRPQDLALSPLPLTILTPPMLPPPVYQFPTQRYPEPYQLNLSSDNLMHGNRSSTAPSSDVTMGGTTAEAEVDITDMVMSRLP
ncbi:hypothetical protein BJY04DRAFT_219291 [Aspergillus karnatakaensis]|uniref:uncharacterized protein n=1 Tax=Aspergillus karnatakaensis TaxID=1810916 RepID=UPI003CCD7331